jgi:hypothetical protein
MLRQAQGMIRIDKPARCDLPGAGPPEVHHAAQDRHALDVKSFDTAIVTGEIPVLTIIDELHELGKKSKARR